MSTDTVTPRDAYAVLLGALHRIERGSLWTSDDWHDEAALAQLTSAEKAAAQQQAIDAGYLERVLVNLGGRKAAVQVPSKTPSRKGGGVQLHIRTGRALPGQALPERHRERVECEGQVDLLELVEVNG